jgi:hypothetical protein
VGNENEGCEKGQKWNGYMDKYWKGLVLGIRAVDEYGMREKVDEDSVDKVNDNIYNVVPRNIICPYIIIKGKADVGQGAILAWAFKSRINQLLNINLF